MSDVYGQSLPLQPHQALFHVSNPNESLRAAITFDPGPISVKTASKRRTAALTLSNAPNEEARRLLSRRNPAPLVASQSARCRGRRKIPKSLGSGVRDRRNGSRAVSSRRSAVNRLYGARRRGSRFFRALCAPGLPRVLLSAGRERLYDDSNFGRALRCFAVLAAGSGSIKFAGAARGDGSSSRAGRVAKNADAR